MCHGIILTLAMLSAVIPPKLAASHAPPDPDRIRQIAREILDIVSGYKSVIDRYREGTALQDQLDALREQIEAKRRERHTVPATDEARVTEELTELEDSAIILLAKMPRPPSEDELRYAEDSFCFRVDAALTTLLEERRSDPPPNISDELRNAASDASAALRAIPSIDACPNLTVRAEEAIQYFESLTNEWSQRERYLSFLRQLAWGLDAVDDVDSLYQNISEITNDAGEALENLAQAAGGDFETLAQVAAGMQLFKSPESEFEIWPAARTISAGLSTIGGSLIVSGKASEWGDGYKTAINLGFILSAAVYLLSDGIDGTTIPAPVKSLAATVAANRMLGLAIQDMYSDVLRAQALARSPEVRDVASTRVDSNTSPLSPGPAAAITPYRAVVDSQIGDLRGNTNATVSHQHYDDLRHAHRDFMENAQLRLDEARQQYFEAVGRVEAARRELSTYRAYVQSLRTAAEKLREILGSAASFLCNDTITSREYEAFCEIRPRDRVDRYRLAELATQVDSSVAKTLAEHGQRLALQARESGKLLDETRIHLDRIESTAEVAWKHYEESFRKWTGRIDALMPSDSDSQERIARVNRGGSPPRP